MNLYDIADIVYVVCRNRQLYQIEKYGRAMTEDEIQDVKNAINASILQSHSKDTFSSEFVIKSVENVVKWYESNLYKNILLYQHEYGM